VVIRSARGGAGTLSWWRGMRPEASVPLSTTTDGA
jgi:hypothetical protein